MKKKNKNWLITCCWAIIIIIIGGILTFYYYNGIIFQPVKSEEISKSINSWESFGSTLWANFIHYYTSFFISGGFDRNLLREKWILVNGTWRDPDCEKSEYKYKYIAYCTDSEGSLIIEGCQKYEVIEWNKRILEYCSITKG